MSGGAWLYRQYRLEETAEQLSTEVATLLRAVAKAEHIVDWSESGDSSRESAEHDLYDLWVSTFNQLYGQ